MGSQVQMNYVVFRCKGLLPYCFLNNVMYVFHIMQPPGCQCVCIVKTYRGLPREFFLTRIASIEALVTDK